VEDEDLRTEIITDEDAYTALFAGAQPQQRIGEASTSYLYTHAFTVPKVRRWYAGAQRLPKVVGMLRNPVERAFSHYTYLVQKGVEDLPFEVAIRPETVAARLGRRYWDFDYLRYGLYADQVAHYLAEFPQARFYLFEDLRRPQWLMDDLCEFLEVRSVVGAGIPHSNVSGVPRSQAMVHLLVRSKPVKGLGRALFRGRMRDAARRGRDALLRRFLVKAELDLRLRADLVDFFRADILRLEAALGRDLSAWLAVSQAQAGGRAGAGG
jgi:hypothetical protein